MTERSRAQAEADGADKAVENVGGRNSTTANPTLGPTDITFSDSASQPYSAVTAVGGLLHRHPHLAPLLPPSICLPAKTERPSISQI